MGDIPRPDPSVLLKNIFVESTSTNITDLSNDQKISKNNNASPSSNKRTLNLNQEQSVSSGEAENKKRKFTHSEIKHQDGTNVDDINDDNNRNNPGFYHHQDVNSNDNDEDDDDDDDCLGDDHIISATIVRRPFT